VVNVAQAERKKAASRLAAEIASNWIGLLNFMRIFRVGANFVTF